MKSLLRIFGTTIASVWAFGSVAIADIGRSDFGSSVGLAPRSTGTFCTSRVKIKWTGDQAFQEDLVRRGVPLALLREGLRKTFGIGVVRDVYTGMEYLDQAGEKGVGEAHYVMGRLALLNPTEINREEARERFSESVGLQCPEGFLGLALLAKGEGKASKALLLTELAIEFGSEMAKVHKVFVDEEARGKDPYETLTNQIKILEELRDGGNRFTESSLAALYLERGNIGKNSGADFQSFVDYQLQAAEKPLQGEFLFSVHEANFNLALTLSRTDKEDSLRALLRSACLYNSKAMVSMGQTLLGGSGSEQDLQSASLWFQSVQSDPLASQQDRDKAASMVKQTYDRAMLQGVPIELLSEPSLPELVFEQCKNVFPDPN